MVTSTSLQDDPTHPSGLTHTARVASAVGATCATALVLVASLALLHSRDDVTFLEGTSVEHGLQWLHGQPIYQSSAHAPFAAAPYGPLFYLIFTTGERLFGGTVPAGYLAGRLLGILSWVFAAAGAWKVARRFGVSRWLSWWVIPAVLSFGVTWPAIGPTTCSVAFELWGLAFYLNESGRKRWWAVPAFLAAALVKENAIGLAVGALGAGVVVGWREKSLRQPLTMAITYLAVLSLSYTLLNLLSHGAFRETMRLEVTDPKNLWTGYAALRSVLLPGAMVTVLAAAAVGSCDFRSRAVVSAGLGVSLALSGFGACKGGADPSYYQPFAFACAGPAVAALDRLLRTLPKVGLGLLAMLIFVMMPDRNTLSAWKQQLRSREYPHAQELSLLAPLPAGPVLSETPSVAVRSGRPAWGTDPYLLTLTYDNANTGELFAAIANDEPAAIVLRKLGFPDRPSFLFRGDSVPNRRFRELVASHYCLTAETAEHVILTPRSGSRCRNPDERRSPR